MKFPISDFPIRVPCSVNTHGSFLLPPWELEVTICDLKLEVAICDFKFLNSSAVS